MPCSNPLFRLIEWPVIGFYQLGKSYERIGSRLPLAPAAVVGTYQSRQNEWVTVTVGIRAAVTKVVRMLGLPEEKYDTPHQQSEAAVLLDATLCDWLRAHDTDEALLMLKKADVVASRIYSVKEMVEDLVFQWREDIISVDDADMSTIRMQSVFPKLKNYGGQVCGTGPVLDKNNELILREW